ncbi:MAG: 4-hydroxy-3-methylbut-2-enyl diphosphate reductase [Alistipes sp.]|jgi:4-hydroxy-3-methylbut-2-enyl diphosphate reductase|nr:4-hydroxy-3-methylbut-2-enyl diphosphate reductase [Alistipes sp.]
MRVTIDDNSGFCFGVVRAIDVAEESLRRVGDVYSLGDIVHNRIEVQRLEELGLHTVTAEDMEQLGGKTLLIRAHGEPPRTYARAEALGIDIVDATCPVVARLQRLVREAYAMMAEVGGSVVLLGKRGHAEVIGLTGQVDDDVRVVEREEDLEGLDYSRPIYFLSQTTQSIDLFNHLAEVIRGRMAEGVTLTVNDTICRRVAGREALLAEFSKSVDVVLFVCGRKSSNGKVLSDVCRAANPRCYNIEEASDVDMAWFEGAESVGICGATSTPRWLMENVASAVEEMCNNR